MAAPYVSGTVALLKNWSRDVFQRELTESELYAQLIKYTKHCNTLGLFKVMVLYI